MVKDKKGISMIIPCYNESPSVLQSTIKELRSSLDTLREIEYEIIVVNDGSIKYNYQKIKNCKIINHKSNKGYGASLKTGILNSKHELIGITDADNTYPNKDISKLLMHIEDNVMVIGKRDKKGVPLSRKAAKWFLNKLANYLTKTNIPDLNSGFRIFNKKLALKFWKLFPEGFSFTSTITIAALINNHKIKYVPIDYYKRKGKSSIKPIKDFLGFIQTISRVILYFKPLNFFMPISLILILLSIIWAIKDLTIYCGAGFLSCRLGLFSVMLFISGLQILFMGLLADLIIQRTDNQK